MKLSAPCSCPVAGYCERHRKKKGRTQHQLCQTDARYRDHWDERAGFVPQPQGQLDAAAPGVASSSPALSVHPAHSGRADGDEYELAPCLHRGPIVRVESCQLCSQVGKPVLIYECSLKGECAIARWQKAVGPGATPVCRNCLDRVTDLADVHSI